MKRIKDEEILLKSSNRSSVKFNIDFLFKPINDTSTECKIEFNGEDINPFMKMMIEKPLKTLMKNFSINLNKL